MKFDVSFFAREADVVARDLLGKVLVIKSGGKMLKSKIVETEAYFDEKDPASRAAKGGDLRAVMQEKAGTILVYGIHNHWMFNIVTGPTSKAQAVLIRALEPINFSVRCSGPGLLSKALGIDKKLHRGSIVDNPQIWIEKVDEKTSALSTSKRIGVTKDLDLHMRFYIKDNPHVSRNK